MNKCPHHPNYIGVSFPKYICDPCYTVWLNTERLKKTPRAAICLASPESFPQMSSLIFGETCSCGCGHESGDCPYRGRPPEEPQAIDKVGVNEAETYIRHLLGFAISEQSVLDDVMVKLRSILESLAAPKMETIVDWMEKCAVNVNDNDGHNSWFVQLLLDEKDMSDLAAVLDDNYQMPSAYPDKQPDSYATRLSNWVF